MPPLQEWIVSEERYAVGALLEAISATHLVTERPGFGQRIIPQRGSVLASPIPAHYDPEPDYFFHWFRDSAIVIDALRVTREQGIAADIAVLRLLEFVEFTRALRSLDGRECLRRDFRTRVQPDFQTHVRPDEELAALRGDAVWADVRVNADGTPDIARWSRPQLDGSPMRALALLRWWHTSPPLDEGQRAALAELIRVDLACTLAHAGEPSVDIWEEQLSHHYYTQLLQSEALSAGAAWLSAANEPDHAGECARAAGRIMPLLASYWSEERAIYRSRSPLPAEDAGRELDIAVVLAVLHAGRRRGDHSVLDPKVQATLTALEELFEAEYAINQQRPRSHGAALGRYPQDRYYSGGAYYFSTLGAAQFYFALAVALAQGGILPVSGENRRFRRRLGLPDGASDRDSATRLALERGDSFLRTVRAFTPAGGELSEQFDRTTGAQSSARHLSWSYAAFITAAAARAQALRAIRGADPAAPPAGTAS
jgi:glucoamylase